MEVQNLNHWTENSLILISLDQFIFHNDKYQTWIKYKFRVYRIGIWQGKKLSNKCVIIDQKDGGREKKRHNDKNKKSM